MKTFSDTEGRKWEVDLNIGAIKRVKSYLDIDLISIHEPAKDGGEPLLTRLATDIVLLCDVIYVIVKPQADKLEVDDEEFGASLGGDSMYDAMEAFFDELINFFQNLKRSEVVKAITAQREVLTLMVQRVSERLDRVEIPNMMKAVDQMLSGDESLKSPESSD